MASLTSCRGTYCPSDSNAPNDQPVGSLLFTSGLVSSMYAATVDGSDSVSTTLDSPLSAKLPSNHLNALFRRTHASASGPRLKGDVSG